VDRNRIKRLLRESVRHAKSGFYSALKGKNKKLTLLLSFQGKEVPALEQVDKSVSALLNTVAKGI
jgi:RNase P protein component